MKENRHAQAIPAQVVAEVKNLLTQVRGQLSPYIVTLTPDERHALLKMGDKSLGFVEKAFEFATDNPELRPPFINMEEFATDYNDAHNLWGIRSLSQQVNAEIDDTIMASGSEAYHSALMFYNAVKSAAANDIPGAKVLYEAMKIRFPYGRRKPSESETETVTETIKRTIKE